MIKRIMVIIGIIFAIIVLVALTISFPVISQLMSSLFESNFFTALAGAGGGAIAGALIAHWISERAILRKSLKQELNDTASALILSTKICSLFIGIKTEAIGPTCEHYFKMRELIEVMLAQPNFENFVLPDYATNDLRNYNLPLIPTHQLHTLIVNNLTPTYQILNLVSDLVIDHAELAKVVQDRNQFIYEHRKSIANISIDDSNKWLYAFETSSGNIDSTLFDATTNIMKYLDHLILLSYKLHRHLHTCLEESTKNFYTLTGEELTFEFPSLDEHIKQGSIPASVLLDR